MTVLTDVDHTFFRENGYVIVPEAVPAGLRAAALAAIWEFLGMEPDEPATWYPPERRGGLVFLHQHQALWDNRQYPRVYEAFAEILGTTALWVSMDRAAMKPPVSPQFAAYDDPGFLHWDLDTSRPLPARRGVQGVLALTDTTADMGGFQCVPGFHRELAGWIAAQPEGRDPRSPDPTRLPPGFAATTIPMAAGDLVVWDRLLAHGNGRNTGIRPRLAQYLTMVPASGDEAVREERIACWRERRPPKSWEREIPEALRGLEQRRPPADLTPLGRRLLGLDRW